MCDADLVAALDQLDELVDHRARLGDVLLVALEGQLVAAQADRALQALAQRVEHAVGDPGELGRDGVRDIERFLHGCQCRLPRMARKWWTLSTVCVATFMLLLDITIVNVALPAIQRALNASFSDLQWVVDAYALALATCVLTAGSLADLFGRKRLFILGIVLFTIASAACGARERPALPDHRARRQGIGGAMMFATALALLSQEFHGKERGTAFGIWGATIGAAVAVGPLAGGMLTSWLSWRWIFLVNIPIGVVAVALAVARLRESSDPEHGRLDPLGLVTLTGGLFCLILALIEGNNHGWSSALILGAARRGRRRCSPAFVVSQARAADADARPARSSAPGVRRRPDRRRSRSRRRCSRCSST